MRLPPGTQVSSAHGLWVGNREGGLWGADGGLFRPERWYVCLLSFPFFCVCLSKFGPASAMVLWRWWSSIFLYAGWMLGEGNLELVEDRGVYLSY